MNLLDNWLVQALVGSFIYSILCKISLNLYKSFKTKNTDIKCSQKSTRMNFYLPLINIIIALIGFAFKHISIKKLNGLLVFIIVIWSFAILIIDFEKFINYSTNKRINERNKHNS